MCPLCIAGRTRCASVCPVNVRISSVVAGMPQWLLYFRTEWYGYDLYNLTLPLLTFRTNRVQDPKTGCMYGCVIRRRVVAF